MSKPPSRAISRRKWMSSWAWAPWPIHDSGGLLESQEMSASISSCSSSFMVPSSPLRMPPYASLSHLTRRSTTWKAKDGINSFFSGGGGGGGGAAAGGGVPADSDASSAIAMVPRMNCWQKQLHTCPAASLIRLPTCLCADAVHAMVGSRDTKVEQLTSTESCRMYRCLSSSFLFGNDGMSSSSNNNRSRMERTYSLNKSATSCAASPSMPRPRLCNGQATPSTTSCTRVTNFLPLAVSRQ
ncbi:uncharacterized protein LOC120712830 [Panicum virgatum]|uniref:uncharacterized protein LOC120712830 n=1 Tax=Panicum virgatum TaxID=38727 RepID=UPI0019D6A8C0|nr:uncharacterized protein LOC120712830 [Panicum virgatum]XP_039854658.1 uncharacterized protein LOC120712830 [Panicum virgatum]